MNKFSRFNRKTTQLVFLTCLSLQENAVNSKYARFIYIVVSIQFFKVGENIRQAQNVGVCSEIAFTAV